MSHCAVHLDADDPFALHLDASGTSVGGALEQYIRSWKPAEFYGRKLCAADQKHSTFDYECVAAHLAIYLDTFATS